MRRKTTFHFQITNSHVLRKMTWIRHKHYFSRQQTFLSRTTQIIPKEVFQIITKNIILIYLCFIIFIQVYFYLLFHCAFPIYWSDNPRVIITFSYHIRKQNVSLSFTLSLFLFRSIDHFLCLNIRWVLYMKIRFFHLEFLCFYNCLLYTIDIYIQSITET